MVTSILHSGNRYNCIEWDNMEDCKDMGNGIYLMGVNGVYWYM